MSPRGVPPKSRGWGGDVHRVPRLSPVPEREEKEKLETDAMFRLEHGAADRATLQRAVPTLASLQEAQSAWKDDFALNSRLRQRFRVSRGGTVEAIVVRADTAGKVLEKGEKITRILLRGGCAGKRGKVKGVAQKVQFLGVKWRQ